MEIAKILEDALNEFLIMEHIFNGTKPRSKFCVECMWDKKDDGTVDFIVTVFLTDNENFIMPALYTKRVAITIDSMDEQIKNLYVDVFSKIMFFIKRSPLSWQAILNGDFGKQENPNTRKRRKK